MSQAQIYKSDLRGCEESDIFRRYATFNFDDYQDHSRQPFGSLVAFNDETLGGRNSMVRQLEEELEVVIIPLVGGLLYKDSLGTEEIIGTEEIRIFSAQQGMYFQLINPYPNDLVNYLQLWLKPNGGFNANSQQSLFELTERNTLIPLFAPIDVAASGLRVNSASYGSIGIYGGRQEGIYQLNNPDNGLFVFVINGAFEFENRLLESRDGLSINGIVKAEFEALSENAILLLIEVPL